MAFSPKVKRHPYSLMSREDIAISLAIYPEQVLHDLCLSGDQMQEAQHAYYWKLTLGCNEFSGRSKEWRVEKMIEFWRRIEKINDAIPHNIEHVSGALIASGIVDICAGDRMYNLSAPKVPRVTVDHAAYKMGELNIRDDVRGYYRDMLVRVCLD